MVAGRARLAGNSGTIAKNNNAAAAAEEQPNVESSPVAIEHLRRLGVTAVSLLPIQQHLTEHALARRGARHYWGYNTLTFYVPDARFAAVESVREFRTMVTQLHAASIEAIVDVVFNHTAESDQRGPTMSWRGLDNASWYRLRHEDARFYENHSGTGNSLDLSQPRVLQFVLDCLRYWVADIHVDGFRFDLAASLARGAQGFDERHPFLVAVSQDPILSRVKLIAEPWDAGPGGYQLGRFPPGWSEWNDRYRDATRAFWVRKTADRGEFAARQAGSSELFHHGRRGVFAGINYVAAHDGFTRHDVLSYDRKHNERNGEENRDGSDHNLSWNCGAEGESDLLMVNTLRSRLKRALVRRGQRAQTRFCTDLSQVRRCRNCLGYDPCRLGIQRPARDLSLARCARSGLRGAHEYPGRGGQSMALALRMASDPSLA